MHCKSYLFAKVTIYIAAWLVSILTMSNLILNFHFGQMNLSLQFSRSHFEFNSN